MASLPGRKNILWFTGALSPPFTPTLLASEHLASGLRISHDELQEARVVLYPIDARGLMLDDPANSSASRMFMDQAAEATGSTATYNCNGAAWEANRIVAHSGHFYTLSHTSESLQFDGKWHHVRITVHPCRSRSTSICPAATPTSTSSCGTRPPSAPAP